ncbi:MAG: hypothetical protein H6627_00680 [Calditrichae bacterium]|nr:hypothetical protein [Calditrichota bacterium]MCB9057051.1 hypothetical protein [Calditrichia bacterium]
MKKCLLLLLMLLPVFGFAQEETLKGFYKDVTTAINSALLTRAGSIEISGLAAYNYEKTKYNYNAESINHLLQIEPVVGYFFFDNIALGLDLNYTYQKSKFSAISRSFSNSQTYAGPFAKLYFGDERFRPFVLASYLVLTGDIYDGGQADLGGGVLYHLDGNIALNFFAKYGLIWNDNTTVDSKSHIFMGLGLSGFIL